MPQDVLAKDMDRPGTRQQEAEEDRPASSSLPAPLPPRSAAVTPASTVNPMPSTATVVP